MTRSTPRTRLLRVRWRTVRVAYCISCQRSYPWGIERCSERGAKLVDKFERVDVSER